MGNWNFSRNFLSSKDLPISYTIERSELFVWLSVLEFTWMKNRFTIETHSHNRKYCHDVKNEIFWKWKRENVNVLNYAMLSPHIIHILYNFSMNEQQNENLTLGKIKNFHQNSSHYLCFVKFSLIIQIFYSKLIPKSDTKYKRLKKHLKWSFKTPHKQAKNHKLNCEKWKIMILCSYRVFMDKVFSDFLFFVCSFVLHCRFLFLFSFFSVFYRKKRGTFSRWNHNQWRTLINWNLHHFRKFSPCSSSVFGVLYQSYTEFSLARVLEEDEENWGKILGGIQSSETTKIYSHSRYFHAVYHFNNFFNFLSRWEEFHNISTQLWASKDSDKNAFRTLLMLDASSS